MQSDASGKYYKYAFFSGFTTISKLKQPSEFFEYLIKPIFLNYKESLKRTQAKANYLDEALEQIVYQPVPYCLFGDFDLAVFSLTEDFGFATKEFKPSPDSGGFKYQVNTGIIPMVETYAKEYPTLGKFENKMLPNFFTGKDFYPFTGITMIKLNNAMLVGNGQDFVTGILFFLITFIDNEIEKVREEGYNLFYILNESLGWNELTINFFGNTMHQMQELLLNIRSKRLFDIIEFLKNDLKNNPKYDYEWIINEIVPMFERVGTDSLLAELIKENDNTDIDFLQSHPIIATSITYGFHAELTNPKNELSNIIDERITDERQLNIFNKECSKKNISIGWKVKPGHEDAAHDLIVQCIGNTCDDSRMYHHTQTGKYSFVYPDKPVSIMEYLMFTRKAEKRIRQDMHQNIIKIQSGIKWSSRVSYTGFVQTKHHHYTHELFVIPQHLIEKVQDKLRTYPVAHIVKGQIENLIINFNDAVCDPLMYSYFMGLKQSLLSFLKDKFRVNLVKEKTVDPADFFIEKIYADASASLPKEENPETELLDDGSEEINIASFLQNWNKAYWNRYFHSYYFTEITDFNMEHHGGIQQILFTYDTMYKLVARRIYGGFTKSPFVNVQGSSTITSTQFYNTVNFNHLFRPSIYACECVHEAANHVIPFLVYQKQKVKYSFLVNFSNRIEFEKRSLLADFEKNIRQHLGARDAYEQEYIENNFGLNTTRQVVTDYFTYRLAYEGTGGDIKEELPFSKNIESAIRFYHCHWFLFLMNTDLYDQREDKDGAWFFKEAEFKQIFIRFNLMFYLFYNCGEKQLEELNACCPSIELKPFWDCRKAGLIQFVIRLGESLEKEFDKLVGTEYDVRGFSQFHQDLKSIIEDGWLALDEEEKEIYSEITNTNFNLIETFYDAFKVNDADKYNIIIRKSNSYYIDPENKKGIQTNVDFYKGLSGRAIFLDPKGNIFSTSPKKRQWIFEKYIFYIKNMWNYSMKIAKKTYLKELAK